MFRNLLLLIVILGLFLFSCEKETIIMPGIENDKELEEGVLIPFTLEQNYPNPFNDMTQILYSVSRQMHLTLKIFTEDWYEVDILVKKIHTPGIHSVTFNAYQKNNETLPSGYYFYTLEGDGFTLIRQMKLVK